MFHALFYYDIYHLLTAYLSCDDSGPQIGKKGLSCNNIDKFNILERRVGRAPGREEHADELQTL